MEVEVAIMDGPVKGKHHRCVPVDGLKLTVPLFPNKKANYVLHDGAFRLVSVVEYTNLYYQILGGA